MVNFVYLCVLWFFFYNIYISIYNNYKSSRFVAFTHKCPLCFISSLFSVPATLRTGPLTSFKKLNHPFIQNFIKLTKLSSFYIDWHISQNMLNDDFDMLFDWKKFCYIKPIVGCWKELKMHFLFFIQKVMLTI